MVFWKVGGSMPKLFFFSLMLCGLRQRKYLRTFQLKFFVGHNFRYLDKILFLLCSISSRCLPNIFFYRSYSTNTNVCPSGLRGNVIFSAPNEISLQFLFVQIPLINEHLFCKYLSVGLPVKLQKAEM